jgi:hypothetical protein
VVHGLEANGIERGKVGGLFLAVVHELEEEISVVPVNFVWLKCLKAD